MNRFAIISKNPSRLNNIIEKVNYTCLEIKQINKSLLTNSCLNLAEMREVLKDEDCLIRSIQKVS